MNNNETPSNVNRVGQWISTYNNTEEGFPYNYCSMCGYETGARCFWDTCPHCDAKMEGEVK